MTETGTRRRLRVLLASGALVLVALLGIAVLAVTTGGSCDEFAAASLTVTVTDAAGRSVCDAEVTATDGSEVFVLESSSCAYVGPWERAGTYVVTVSHSNGVVASDPVRVDADECHVDPQRVELTLPA